MEIKQFYETNTIENDFDEIFYQKEYPKTKQFYQPYCKNNNIDDKHRLYYHYKLYGENKYKNLEEKNKNKFIPIISPRKKVENKLAILTTFFNPCNYINLKYNYLKFSKHIRSHGDLFPIELSFSNNFFIEDKNLIRISGDQSNILWQKEVLLNIALEQLPKEYTDVAWIDSDIIFNDTHWHIRLFDMLSRYKIIQLFSNGFRINEKNEKLKDNAFVSKIKSYPYGVTGFAWSARREILDEIKFLDNQVLGGADYIMCSAFIKQPSMLNDLKHHISDDYSKQWIQQATEVVDCSTSFLNNEIIHLYHGKTENRNYQDRYELLQENAFLAKDTLWKTDDNTSKNTYHYFQSRNEDDNIIEINKYFDQVYLLNLDKELKKLNATAEKLKSLNINYDRFVALDGDLLQFENKNFVIGEGMIENKYALACKQSHINIIKDAKLKNYKKILIFEDDVLFAKNFNVLLQNLREIKDWKLLYFGCSQHTWDYLEYIDNYYYAKNTCGTFAYAIDCSIYDELIDLCQDEIHAIDKNLSDIQDKYYKQCYVFYPNLCSADVSDSSIRESRDRLEHGEKMRWNILKYN
jgi:GR25 family glycosyltransferase involved in LPS biosynthesis